MHTLCKLSVQFPQLVFNIQCCLLMVGAALLLRTCLCSHAAGVKFQACACPDWKETH
jgi:hypothetical protein